MKLSFHGAAGEVTGSCYHLRTDRANVLIDCGLFQGGNAAELKNRRPFPFDVAKLDAVVLTHAHLDHSGRLPMLLQRGLRARIWTTPVSIELADILLHDSAHIQADDLARCLRGRELRGGNTKGVCLIPLYNDQDVTRTVGAMSALPYEQPREIAPGVTLRFRDAGHILGSASVELVVQDAGRTRRLIFSGDVGEIGSVILRDPQSFESADVVVMESTYGDRDHKPLGQTLDEFKAVVRASIASRGKVIIPTFAIGRTQTLVYHLGQMFRAGELPPIPVWVDSPMAVRATRLYEAHRELFDDEALAHLKRGNHPLRFPNLHMSSTADESRALNGVSGPVIILAPAGMCTGGRILHHLRNNLHLPTTHVIIAGYQAEGTLGRKLVERAPIVRIYGQEVAVRAQIYTMGGFSAHAGASHLIDWAGAWSASKPRLFLTHGEDAPRAALRDQLRAAYALEAAMPRKDDSVSL